MVKVHAKSTFSSKNIILWQRHKNIKMLTFSFSEFVCVEVLQPSQPNGVMSSAVSLPNHTFTGQA